MQPTRIRTSNLSIFGPIPQPLHHRVPHQFYIYDYVTLYGVHIDTWQSRDVDRGVILRAFQLWFRSRQLPCFSIIFLTLYRVNFPLTATQGIKTWQSQGVDPWVKLHSNCGSDLKTYVLQHDFSYKKLIQNTVSFKKPTPKTWILTSECSRGCLFKQPDKTNTRCLRNQLLSLLGSPNCFTDVFGYLQTENDVKNCNEFNSDTGLLWPVIAGGLKQRQQHWP